MQGTHQSKHDGRPRPRRVVVAQHDLLLGLEPERVVESFVGGVAGDEPRRSPFLVRLRTVDQSKGAWQILYVPLRSRR